MKQKLSLIVVALVLSAALGAQATTYTKGDNITALNLVNSWSGGPPGSGDIANWSGTYNTAGSLSAALGANLSWAGITIGSISGTAAGLISIGGTGAAANTLALGTSGINMSSANQSLVINATTLAVGSNSQTWNIASGLKLVLGTYASGGKGVLTGNSDAIINISGSGKVDLNPTSTGMGGYAGKWIVNSGATLISQQNKTTAFGTNTSADAITLNGGTLAVGSTGTVLYGNWTWNTKMTLADGTTSYIDNQLPSNGNTRWLKLESAIAGGALNTGNLTFKSTSSAVMGSDEYGFILAGANTFNGTLTINASTYVRIGGSAAGTSDSNAGNNGSISSSAAIVDNGVLRLTRNDTWTLANNISGSGQFKIGGTVGTTTSQVVTLSGLNSYSGGTTFVNGTTKLGSANALPTTGTVKFVGGTLNLNGYSPTVAAIAGGTAGTGTITGSGTLTVSSSFHVAETSGVSNTLQVTGGTLDLSGGTLHSYVSYGGSSTGVLTINGGTVNAYQIDMAGSASGNGTVTLTSGTLNIGAGGIMTTAGTYAVNLGAGTVGSLAGWSSSLNMALTGTSTATTMDTTGGNISLSGILSGTGGKLTKSGSGTLTLSGANTYTGDTTLSAGQLNINHATALGGAAGTFIISGGTTIDNTSAAAITLSNNNAQNWNGNFTFTGTQSLNLGNGAVTMDATRTVTVSANTLTVGGVISGGGFGLTRMGGGTLALTGTASTFTGQVTLTGGTTTVAKLANSGSNSSLGTGSAASSIIMNGSALSYTGTGGDTTDRAIDMRAGATINNNGSGAITFTAANVIQGGTASARTLTLGGTNAGANNFQSIIGDSGTGANITSLVKNGAGVWILSGANTYTGGTTLSAGTLNINNATALGGSAGAFTISGGTTIDNTSAAAITLSNNNAQNWNGDFTFTGTKDLNLGTGAVTMSASRQVTASAGNLTVGGIISGSTFTLTKLGAGTLTLSGANTYTGATYVNVGTLRLTGASAKLGGTSGSSADANNICFNGSSANATLEFETAAQLGVASQIRYNTQGGGPGILRYVGTTTETVSKGIYCATSQGLEFDSDSSGGSLTISGSFTTGGAGSARALYLGGTGTGANTVSMTMASGKIDSLTKKGTGLWAITGNNGYAGGTTISDGTLELGGTSATVAGSGAIQVASGAVLQFNNSASVLALANNITGSGTINKISSYDSGLTGSNSFSGQINITGGKIAFQGANSGSGAPKVNIGASGTMSVGDGYAGGTLTISELQGSGTINGIFGTAGTRSLNINQSTDTAFSGTISQDSINRAVAISKSGSGKLTLSGAANGYAASDITIDGGTLQIGAAESSTAIFNSTARTITVNSGGTLALIYRNAFGAVGSTPTTKLVIDGGTVIGSSGASGSVNVLQDLTLKNGAVLEATQSYNPYQAYQLQGTVTVTGSSASSITTVTGGITVGNATNNSGVTEFNVADVTSNVNADLTISAPIANSGNNGANKGGLRKSGLGTLVLSGTSTYTGDTTISGGTLALGHATDTLSSSSAVNVNGGELAIGANSDTVGAVTLASGSITGSTGVLTGSSYAMQTGSVSAILGGSGITLTKSTGGTVTLSGNNTYTGMTTINAGTLELSGGSAIADAGAVSLADASGAILKLSGSETIGSLAGGGTTGGEVNLQGNKLTVGDANDTSYGGIISGSGGQLTKQGSGKLTLTGTSIYTGATSIVAGVVEITSTGALGSGEVTLSDSAQTLINNGTIGGQVTANAGTVKGNGTFNGGLIMASGTTHAPGNSPGSEIVSGTLEYNGAALVIDIWTNDNSDIAVAGTDYDQITISSGTLTLSNAPNIIVDLNGTWNPTPGNSYVIITGFSNTVTSGFDSAVTVQNASTAWTDSKNSFSIVYNANDITLTVIPEPGTVGIVATFLAAALLRRRRFG